jgi:predicted RNA methylase
MKSISDSSDEVLLERGCGMGRADCLAGFYSFRAIIGVEISPELCEIARENVMRLKPRLACSNIAIVNSNAVQYKVPADVSVVFFFNPFGGAVMAAVLNNLADSVRIHPRKLKVIFCGTVSASGFEAEADKCSWLTFRQELQLPTGVRSLIYEARSGTV